MRALVYNDNQHVKVWKETFKGDPIEITFGKPLEMEFFDAHEFRGQYFPRVLLGDGTQDPKTMKMIRVEKIEAGAEAEEGIEVFQCMLCKKAYSTEKALNGHSDAEHADQQVTDPLLDAEIAKKKGKTKTTTKTETI